MSARFDDVADDLRAAYAGGVEYREAMAKTDWKLAERAAFLDRLRAAGARTLVEIGAGTGQDALYFQSNGLDVVATDLTAEMVAACAAKGLSARVMSVVAPDLPAGSFDAAYALNCLLHVPNADLPAALSSVNGLLRPGGLFFLGVYGGDGSEGVVETDRHDPPRFFSWRTDEQLLAFTGEHFDVVDFHRVPLGAAGWFQSLTLRGR
ncbi:class I SAM-dependent methyltransferase [Jiangella mangrovi]|uniref:SAM-dependent methyltransferase n=1 Tax=Jiangella mangrovi TaxID=1524084 RepID=A0A7W9LJ57_9ACTN|nr:class I SAM-dependent methyltransferase [Jiangella mangrovi]MBB5785698.1 SAM-dependent methyltransferase [Jiangella mangrovi]